MSRPSSPFVARWTAIAIAVAAIIDPPVRLPARERPALRVVGAPGDAMVDVTRRLSDAGFALHETGGEAATVLVGSALSAEHPALTISVWVVDTAPPAPNVRLVTANGPATRFPGQAVEVRLALDAQGMAGKTSQVVLEDAGIRVASVRHEWKAAVERWHGSLQYLPPGAAAGRLRVTAVELPGETSTDDNAADIAVPPMRGPIRTLVVEAGVTWPAMFVRRAIEGEAAFAVAAVQRATARIATRAGAPPAVVTRGTLARFEVALVGAPGNLTAGEVDALRWFVEERGGLAVFVADRPPGRGYLWSLGAPLFEPRQLEAAAPLGQGLMASELLIGSRLPPGSRVLAGTRPDEAVVFSARRGAGAVIFSGALDAWRYRANEKDAFARFWRRAILDEAATVPPVLEVTVNPSLVSLGATTRVRARLRATELVAEASVASPRSPVPDPRSLTVDSVAARAVSPAAHVDEAVRLWPTAEPGVYEGDWRPSTPGDYDLAVTAGTHRGDAAVTVAPSHAAAADPEGLALVARASGGRVFRAGQSAMLVEEMKTAFPARAVTKMVNPMRSPWWVVPFAGLLCAEWGLRRKRGLP